MIHDKLLAKETWRWLSLILIVIVSVIGLYLIISRLPPPIDMSAQTDKNIPRAFGSESFTLANGMKVIVIPNHRAPVVTHMVWYLTGAADEAHGESGIAHFVEHLMFRGTQMIGPGEFSRKIRAMGGIQNAFTSQDTTAYFQSISKDHLADVMRMEADRMNNLIFPEEDVAAEQKVVIEERRQRTENDPRGYFFEQLRAMLFTNHPYGHPVIGWLHEVDALDRPHVKKFYDTWYAPNNAILIVAGDVTADELKPLAQEIYGVLPAEEVPARKWTEVPPLIALPRLELNHKDIQQPAFYRLWRVPSYAQDYETALAFDLLAEIVDGGAATRLYNHFVRETGLASSASFWFSGTQRSDAMLGLTLIPADGISLEVLEHAADQFLADLSVTSFSEEEINEARLRLQDQAVFARDSLSGPAMIIGHMVTAGVTLENIETWPTQLELVDPAAITQAAGFVSPDGYGQRPYVTGLLMPAAGNVPASEQETASFPLEEVNR